jgi:hypothetical protein
MAKALDQAEDEVREAWTILQELELASGMWVAEKCKMGLDFASTLSYTSDRDWPCHIFLNHYQDPDGEWYWLVYWQHDGGVVEKRRVGWEEAKTYYLDVIRELK